MKREIGGGPGIIFGRKASGRGETCSLRAGVLLKKAKITIQQGRKGGWKPSDY